MHIGPKESMIISPKPVDRFILFSDQEVYDGTIKEFIDFLWANNIYFRFSSQNRIDVEFRDQDSFLLFKMKYL